MSAIDTGVGETVKEKADDVEADGLSDTEQEEKEEEEEFSQKGSWFFASTACPLLAGTFGPIASGFNICALANEWRVYIPPEGTEEHGAKISDPSWLIAVNTVSLICALIANGSLLANMGRRLKFSIAQPITIIGFFLAGMLLIADMAAITSSPTYFLTGQNAPSINHALTAAFYYAIWAAVFYIIIALLMCLTVYGALKGKYERDFRLTSSQRTLMLQTMAFVAYLLLGALVFSRVEGWNYLEAVYWADVTLLTVGMGDYSPSTTVGRGLLFPFAIGGILIVGLVVGSIRSLVLERGQEKLSARIVEKRRSEAVHNVDARKQTIKISWLAKADFNTDPAQSPAQRREEEFNVMRKVQATAQRERRWLGLATSATFALGLWFIGAAIFMVTEHTQQWTYFQSLYFAYTSLLTIGYGDYHPDSNSGRAFFVVWSLLAVPSLTILISNMGDTIVQWFSDLTMLVGSITVLPGENGFRAGTKAVLQSMIGSCQAAMKRFSPPGLLGASSGHSMKHEKRMPTSAHEDKMMDGLAERLTTHVGKDEKEKLHESERGNDRGDQLEQDIQFYHYVLARECRNVQKDLGASPPKEYSWQDWEYFLKLMGNEDDPKDYPGQDHPDILVPGNLRMAPSKASGAGSDATMTEMTDGAVDRDTETQEWKRAHADNKRLKSNPDRKQKRRLTTMDLHDWSWLSANSPLRDTKSEAEWILDRLSAALERELNRRRKGYKRKPPVTMADVKRKRAEEGSGPAAGKEEDSLEKAAGSRA